MTKTQMVFEIVLLLQGTPLDDFALQNFLVDGDRALVRCASRESLATPEGSRVQADTNRVLVRAKTAPDLQGAAVDPAHAFWIMLAHVLRDPGADDTRANGN